MTWSQSGIVTPLSAAFVARITRTVPGPAPEKTASWSSKGTSLWIGVVT